MDELQTKSTEINFQLSKLIFESVSSLFQVHGLGPLTNCSGDLDVRFFPEVVEDFSHRERTVSYRHHADFTKNKNPICRYIVAELSPVAVGKCEETIPKKYNPAEAAMVPFRTIVPSANGDSAIVSSPRDLIQCLFSALQNLLPLHCNNSWTLLESGVSKVEKDGPLLLMYW